MDCTQKYNWWMCINLLRSCWILGLSCHFICEKFCFFLCISNWCLSFPRFFCLLLTACLTTPARDPELCWQEWCKPTPGRCAWHSGGFQRLCRVLGGLRGALPALAAESFVLSPEASGAGLLSTKRLPWALSFHCPVWHCMNGPVGVPGKHHWLSPFNLSQLQVLFPTLAAVLGTEPRVLYLWATPPALLYVLFLDRIWLSWLGWP